MCATFLFKDAQDYLNAGKMDWVVRCPLPEDLMVRVNTTYESDIWHFPDRDVTLTEWPTCTVEHTH